MIDRFFFSARFVSGKSNASETPRPDCEFDGWIRVVTDQLDVFCLLRYKRRYWIGNQLNGSWSSAGRLLSRIFICIDYASPFSHRHFGRCWHTSLHCTVSVLALTRLIGRVRIGIKGKKQLFQKFSGSFHRCHGRYCELRTSVLNLFSLSGTRKQARFTFLVTSQSASCSIMVDALKRKGYLSLNGQVTAFLQFLCH